MRIYKKIIICLVISAVTGMAKAQTTSPDAWSKEKANEWYKKQGWLVGSNYTPAYAINQLEFWQAATFDAKRIDLELGWAEGLGMNTMRVFLHDLLYQQDSTGFYERMNTFLQIAQKHKIKTLFVFFDSCWDPNPRLGTQRAPKPRVHNSGWVQSPGAEALKDSTQYPRLERYVKSVLGKFGKDERVLGWDVWNEPDNDNGSSYKKMGQEIPNKTDYVLPLLKKAFVWVHEAKPSQPITAAIWLGDWSTWDKLSPLQQVMVGNSDVISFHNYDGPEEFEKRILWLQQYGRPILCTEYMARPNHSTFQGSLPIAKKHNVAAYNWGFVDGKTQTIYPWDSWDKQYTAEPPVWFHDVFKNNGTPYKKEETDLIRRLAKGK